MVVIQIQTLHTFSVLFFASGRFLKILSFYISVPKKKTVESTDIRLMFLSRSMGKQAGHDLY